MSSYYSEHSASFIDSTVNVDMTPVYAKVLPFVTGRRILDAGCGSGRDAKEFSEMGFDVEAFDACPELADYASKLIGKKVECCTFTEFSSETKFDLVWACASLLHVKYDDLPGTLSHMTGLLAPNGILYCSFKYGNSEVARGERTFTDMNKERLAGVALKAGLVVFKTWVTGDQRKGRESELWLNAILCRGQNV